MGIFYDTLVEDVVRTLPFNYKQAGILVVFAIEEYRPDGENIIKGLSSLKEMIKDINGASGDELFHKNYSRNRKNSQIDRIKRGDFNA